MSATPPAIARLSWIVRWALVISGATGLALLVLAATLKPDERGYGTHRQLGLPPCTIQFTFGVRCPSCGMTTSWSHLTRGRLGKALQANVGGVLLGVLTAAYGVWAVMTGVRGGWLGRRPKDLELLMISGAVLFVMFGEWVIRLVWETGR